MNQEKSPSESFVHSRKLVMPDQINPNGTLFGGVLMSWMDKVAYMAAQRHAGKRHVLTVNIDQIHFSAPIGVGDQVELTAVVEYVGRTSMEVAVEVNRLDVESSQIQRAASAQFTFVAVDEHLKPVPVPQIKLVTELEKTQFEKAKLRVKIRGRLRNWFQERFPQRMSPSLGQDGTLAGWEFRSGLDPLR